MILREQMLKPGKIYYHGTTKKEIDKKNAAFPEAFYITPAFEYAKTFAEDGEVSYIREVSLKKPLNIFNLRSEKNLRLFLDNFEEDGYTEEFLRGFAENDWFQYSNVINGKSVKKDFVEKVESLGFDGFFTWEEAVNNFSYYNDSPEGPQHSRPCYGIFDIKNLEFGKIWNLKTMDISKNPKVKRQTDYEKDYFTLQYILYELMQNDFDYSYIAKKLTAFSVDDLKREFRGLSKERKHLLVKIKELYTEFSNEVFDLDDEGAFKNREALDILLEYLDSLIKKQLLTYDLSEVDLDNIRVLLDMKLEKFLK